MEEQKFKVWITAYALSTGVFEAEARLGRTSTDMIIVKGARSGYSDRYFHSEGKDWHRTAESAQARVKVMVENKLKSLRKQIEKLEKML